MKNNDAVVFRINPWVSVLGKAIIGYFTLMLFWIITFKGNLILADYLNLLLATIASLLIIGLFGFIKNYVEHPNDWKEQLTKPEVQKISIPVQWIYFGFIVGVVTIYFISFFMLYVHFKIAIVLALFIPLPIVIIAGLLVFFIGLKMTRD